MNNFENIKKKFNWGAFLLTWIWGICNKVYITLFIIPIAYIPKVGLIINIFISIWLGFNGNKLALKNKKNDDLENFLKHQKKWAIAGFIYCFIIILITTFIMIYTKSKNYAEFYYKNSIIKDSTNISKTTITNTIDKLNKKMISNKSQKIKCPLEQNQMAEFFSKDLNLESENNVVGKPGYQIFFKSDGACKQPKACTANIIFQFELGNLGYTTAESKVYLNTDEAGYLYISNIEPKKFKFKEIYINQKILNQIVH